MCDSNGLIDTNRARKMKEVVQCLADIIIQSKAEVKVKTFSWYAANLISMKKGNSMENYLTDIGSE